MAGYLKYVLISIITISLLAKFLLIVFNQGLWWDEAVYLGLGKNIPKGFYSLDPGEPLETFRPPLFPLLVSPLSSSILLSRILVVCFSILAVVLTYLLSKKLFGKETALWVSLFLSTNQLFIFFTTKTLTESLFISSLSLSLIFFLGRKDKPSYSLLSGIFAGLAFLTRYLGTVLSISYVIYFLYLLSRRKDTTRLTKELFLLLAGIFIVISPWLFMSQTYYGNIFGAYSTNIMEYSDQGRFFTSYLTSVIDYSYFNYIFQAFGLQIIFIVLGFYFMARHGKTDNRILLIIIFLMPLIFFSLAPYREPRYLLSYSSMYAIFSGFALRQKVKLFRLLHLLAILACIFSMISGFGMVWNDRFAANGLVQASLHVKNLTVEDDYVMSQSYPYVYYLSERRAVIFPRKMEDLKTAINEKNIRYVLLYKFEPKNPEYVEDYFDNSDEFVLVRKFEQWGDPEAARIYEFTG